MQGRIFGKRDTMQRYWTICLAVVLFLTFRLDHVYNRNFDECNIYKTIHGVLHTWKSPIAWTMLEQHYLAWTAFFQQKYCSPLFQLCCWAMIKQPNKIINAWKQGGNVLREQVCFVLSFWHACFNLFWQVITEMITGQCCDRIQ